MCWLACQMRGGTEGRGLEADRPVVWCDAEGRGLEAGRQVVWQTHPKATHKQPTLESVWVRGGRACAGWRMGWLACRMRGDAEGRASRQAGRLSGVMQRGGASRQAGRLSGRPIPRQPTSSRL